MKISDIKNFENSLYDEDWGTFVARSQAEGLKIVLPKPNQLLIDIDTPEQYKVYQTMEPVIRHFFTIADSKETVSRNGLPGRHIVIDLAYDLDDMERVLLQAVMGSDPIRELFSYIRIKSGEEHPTALLEK